VVGCWECSRIRREPCPCRRRHHYVEVAGRCRTSNLGEAASLRSRGRHTQTEARIRGGAGATALSCSPASRRGRASPTQESKESGKELIRW